MSRHSFSGHRLHTSTGCNTSHRYSTCCCRCFHWGRSTVRDSKQPVHDQHVSVMVGNCLCLWCTISVPDKFWSPQKFSSSCANNQNWAKPCTDNTINFQSGAHHKVLEDICKSLSKILLFWLKIYTFNPLCSGGLKSERLFWEMVQNFGGQKWRPFLTITTSTTKGISN